MNQNQERRQQFQFYKRINDQMLQLQNIYSPEIQIEDLSLSSDNIFSRQSSSLKTNIPQTQIAIKQLIKTKQKKRVDNKSKCFSQNLFSFCYTRISKILLSKQKDKKLIKEQIKGIRSKLDLFLNKYKAKNSQLILFFISFFLKFQQAEAYYFKEMKKHLIGYLDQREKQAQSETPQERIKLLSKVTINRQVIERYFVPQDIQIDTQWIKEVCGEMFTGRQRNTIDKPIRALKQIQFSLTQQKVIQTYFNL